MDKITYRGCIIEHYAAGEKAPGEIWIARRKNDRQINGWCKTKSRAKKLIDDYLTEPPQVVKTHKGIPIYYPVDGRYKATIDGHSKYASTREEVEKWIDHELYRQSEEYQNKKAEEEAARQEAIERAQVYGEGRDEEGNLIEPTEEQQLARERFYAKERYSRQTSIREEYEAEKGIVVTDEEQAKRDEYLIEESKTRQNWLMVYWLSLKNELRKLRARYT